LKIGSKVNLLSQTVDRYAHVAEVLRGRSLEWRWWKTGGLCVIGKFPGHCDEKAYLDAEFRAPGAAMGEGAWRNHQALGLPTRTKIIGFAADFPDPFLAAALSLAARSAPMPWPGTCCARGQAYPRSGTAMGSLRKVCALRWTVGRPFTPKPSSILLCCSILGSTSTGLVWI